MEIIITDFISKFLLLTPMYYMLSFYNILITYNHTQITYVKRNESTNFYSQVSSKIHIKGNWGHVNKVILG